MSSHLLAEITRMAASYGNSTGVGTRQSIRPPATAPFTIVRHEISWISRPNAAWCVAKVNSCGGENVSPRQGDVTS